MNPLLFWSLGGALTLGIAVFVAWPLLRPQAGRDAREHAVAVYRDQLDEVDRDRARNLIDDEQAEAAKLEIQRRLLAVTREAERGVGTVRMRPVAAALLALAVGLGSLGVYATIGRPGLPGQPFAGRDQSELREERERQARQLAELEKQVGADPPESAEFWFALGRLRAQLLGPASAIQAFREGLARNPESVPLLAGLGEVLVEQAQGTVTPSAREAFALALDRAPDQPQALFYLGMAAAQEGDDQTALERWGRLLETSPADAPWRPSVEAQYREVAERAGVDAEALLAERGGTTGAPPAAGAMSEAERQAMIQSMVDGLAARLEENPEDVDGWLRLGRSRLVLGEDEGAVEAYARARALAPANPDALLGEAEARLAAADRIQGVPMVSETLSRLLQEVAALQPENPQPHWYLGLHALQQGDIGGARDRWQTVLTLLGPDNPSYAAVKEQIEALPSQGG